MGIRKINYTVIAPEVEQEIKDKYTKQETEAMLSDKVSNSRVLTDVPVNAKFTDTIYSEISTAEIDVGTASTLRVITGRRIKYTLDKVQGWISSITKVDIGLGNVDNLQQATKVEFNTHNNDAVRHITDTERMAWNSKQDVLGYTPLNNSLKGANGGLAELDSTGKVPSSQLPSYVDDVLEYISLPNFPPTGETGKIYVATDTNLTYRWSGTGYVEISPSLALGETSSTAYRGDRGKVAYDHSQSPHAPSDSISKSNITLYTPASDYHPATKKYVDDNNGLIIP